MIQFKFALLSSTMSFGLASVLVLAGCGSATDDPVSPTSTQSLAPSPVGAPADAPKARGPAGLIERFDANKNGKLEASELPQRARERWGTADANGDGVITEAELRTAMDKHQAERFATADANGDGQVTQSEVGDFRWDHMKVADSNGDGKLSLEELRAAHAEGKLGPPEGGHGRRGGPGGWGHGGQGKPGERVFERFDANSDGKLEKSEVPDFVWDHLSVADANRDGALTHDEIQAAHENGTLKPPPGHGGRRGPCAHEQPPDDNAEAEDAAP